MDGTIEPNEIHLTSEPIAEATSNALNVLCVASDFKGVPFIERAKRLGNYVILLTREKYRHSAWGWANIDELHCVQDDAKPEDYVRAATDIARNRRFDRVCPLDEFDVLPCAEIRCHLQIEGQTIDSATRFRDKLTMRNVAAKAGIPCPTFVGLFNPTDIENFANSVEPEWIIKPRSEVSAFGIRKLSGAEELWENLRELDLRGTWRDHPSQYLLEDFIKGRVYHVDSISFNGEVLFASVGTYGTPPLKVTHEGGVSSTRLLSYKAKERKELEKLNKKLLKAFDYKEGITHAEFLQCEETGKFFLLEVASRVGGAFIADVLHASSGINLWAEWASVQLATPEKPYKLPKFRKDYGGIVITLARQEFPDTSSYNDEEIVFRINKPYHIGLLVTSPSLEKVETLLNNYVERFAEDFMAKAKAKEHYDD